MPCCGKKDPNETECEETCDKGLPPSKKQLKKQSALARLNKGEKSIKSSKSIKSDKTPIDEQSRHNIFLTKVVDHPVPYTFRVPVHISPIPHVSSSKARPAKSPPFYLLLDHTIAVIWCLFSPDKKDKINLGISQLQWALYLLRGTKMPDGNYLPDVAIAIRAIEDSLIESYADMSSVVMQTPPFSRSCITCDLQHIVPQSKCNVCSSEKGMAPRRSHRTIPIDFDGSLYGTYRTPRHINKHQFLLETGNCNIDPSENVKNDIIRLKALAATMSKEQMITNYEQDAILDQLHKWNKEEVGRLKEEIEQLRKSNQFKCTNNEIM